MTTIFQGTRTRLFIVTLRFALGLFAKAFGQPATSAQQFLQTDRLATDDMSGSATGFFVDSAAFLITCAHVVNGPGEIMVIVSSGEMLPAKIYKIDDRFIESA
jgi:S1-C subfamily serine protease